MTDEVKHKLQKRIEELKRRMEYDANDLDYETHLQMMRDLRHILNKTKDAPKRQCKISNLANGKASISAAPIPHVGHINFLNCQPLTYSYLQCGYHRGLRLIMAVPSTLNKAMTNNQLQVSPMSSFAFAKISDRLLMLPNLGIVADDDVLSIILVSKCPIEKLDGKEILLTAQSATSHCLLKIIMQKAYHCKPLYQTEKLDPYKPLAKGETADLFIGDDALYIRHHEEEGLYYYDLGRQWKKLTDMPMVYAVWAATKDFAADYPEQLAMVYSRIRGGFDNGNDKIQAVTDMVIDKKPFTREQLLEYFTVIKYDVQKKQLTALKKFYTLAYECGLLKNMPDIEIAVIK